MDAPSRFVLVIGGVLGLLMVVFAPGWFGGADEGTHFMRAVAMADGGAAWSTDSMRALSLTSPSLL